MTRYPAPTFVCIALVLLPLGCATAKSPQDTLDVKQLRIVDTNGVPQMVLAASMPGRGRAVQGAGIVFNDAHGREIGGVGLVEKSHSSALCFDYRDAQGDAHGEAICVYRFGDGSAGVAINDPAANLENKRSGSGKERLRFEVDHGQSTVILSDTNEKPRIRLLVAPNDTPHIEILDANGKVIYTLPPQP